MRRARPKTWELRDMADLRIARRFKPNRYDVIYPEVLGVIGHTPGSETIAILRSWRSP